MGLFKRRPWSPRPDDVVRLPGWGPHDKLQIDKVEPDGLRGYFYMHGAGVQYLFFENVNPAGEARQWERVG